MSYFHEEQRFARSWPWLIAALVLIGAVVSLLEIAAGFRTVAAAVAAVLVIALVAGLLLVARLVTDVTADEIVIAFHGLWPTRRVKLDDVVGHEARTYSLLDSGGWGVHFGLAGMTYNVSGNRGVQLHLLGSGRVRIGSTRADELDAALTTALAARSGARRGLP